jgi:hypothetical protein
MDVAALVISILALAVAVASAAYARRQAQSAKYAVQVEEQRRYQERVPTFAATIEDVSDDGDSYRLRLMLTTLEELEGVEVTLPRGCSFEFTQHMSGVKSQKVAVSTTIRVLPRSNDHAWRVEMVSESRGTEWLIVRAVSSRDSARWTVRVPVEPPFGGITIA